MRRILAVATLCMSAMACAYAHAQEADTSLSVAAQELIARGNAAGVFEALPSDGPVVVRHGRSGLVCRLAPANTNRLVIFPQAARGEDVACDSSDGSENITLYATRYSFDPSMEELIQGAVAAIRQRFPDARELPAPTGAGARAQQRTAQFLVTREDDGALMYTRVSVAQIGQWVVKLRYTVVAPDAAAAERGEAAANALWNATLGEFSQQRL